MPDKTTLQKQRDDWFYSAQRSFAERRRRKLNGRQPRPKPALQDILDAPIEDAELASEIAAWQQESSE